MDGVLEQHFNLEVVFGSDGKGLNKAREKVCDAIRHPFHHIVLKVHAVSGSQKLGNLLTFIESFAQNVAIKHLLFSLWILRSDLVFEKLFDELDAILEQIVSLERAIRLFQAIDLFLFRLRR